MLFGGRLRSDVRTTGLHQPLDVRAHPRDLRRQPLLVRAFPPVAGVAQIVTFVVEVAQSRFTGLSAPSTWTRTK